MKHLQLLTLLMGWLFFLPQTTSAQKGNLQKGDYGYL